MTRRGIDNTGKSIIYDEKTGADAGAALAHALGYTRAYVGGKEVVALVDAVRGRGGKRRNQAGRPNVLGKSVTTTAMIPVELRDRIAASARANGQSLGAEIRDLLALGLRVRMPARHTAPERETPP